MECCEGEEWNIQLSGKLRKYQVYVNRIKHMNDVPSEQRSMQLFVKLRKYQVSANRINHGVLRKV